MNKRVALRRVGFVAIILGGISFVCLILYFLALTDVWHESGSPDFWHGEGLCSVEWRLLAVCYWPMFLFHVCFSVVAMFAMKCWRNETPPGRC